MPMYIVSSMRRYEAHWAVTEGNAATEDYEKSLGDARERARTFGRTYYVHRRDTDSPRGSWTLVIRLDPKGTKG